jgi:hypothetical protein
MPTSQRSDSGIHAECVVRWKVDPIGAIDPVKAADPLQLGWEKGIRKLQGMPPGEQAYGLLPVGVHHLVDARKSRNSMLAATVDPCSGYKGLEPAPGISRLLEQARVMRRVDGLPGSA